MANKVNSTGCKQKKGGLLGCADGYGCYAQALEKMKKGDGVVGL